MAEFCFNPLAMAIKPLLEKAREEDPCFDLEVEEKEARTEKPKSLAECADYIMGEAYEYASKNRNGNFGLAGCDDSQIVGMIKHYYDEDDIVIKKTSGATSKVATAKVATTKEAREAREKALKEKKEAEKKEREEAKAKAKEEEKARKVAERELARRTADLERNGGDLFAEMFS